jgi:acetolactate synthase-1/3 small subunit
VIAYWLLGRPQFPEGLRVFDFRGLAAARAAGSAGDDATEPKPWPRKRRRIQDMQRHTISVLVENKFGVLTRVTGLFSGRGYNIDTLNVGPTQDESLSRMTIVTRGDASTVEQIVKLLDKLVDVVRVIEFKKGSYIDRELVLVRVKADATNRAEVCQLAELFRAKIVDVQPESVTVEITGGEQKIEKFLLLMKGFGILDLTRTGQVALPRE